MRPLRPCGISAWSWVNAQGKGHRLEVPAALAPSLPCGDVPQKIGLVSHEELWGIPGFSGFYPGELPPLPARYSASDSRCARLLFAALQPLMSPLRGAIDRWGDTRLGIIAASSTGGVDATERALKLARTSGELPSSFHFDQSHPYHALLKLLLSHLGINAPHLAVSTACSSGGKALASAQRWIHSGQVDAVLVAGADALCELTIRGFAGLGVLSHEPCRPFDKTRSGISIGEGAALLLLEKQTSRGPYLLSVGESADAHHPTTPHPEGRGAILSINQALRLGNIRPEDVDYVNAHGTGTEKNDLMEAHALKTTLGSLARFSSTKHLTGHQLGTAGTTEAIYGLQALEKGVLPGNIHPREQDPSLAIAPYTNSKGVPDEKKPEASSKPHIILSNSFAFGGSNVTIALGDNLPQTIVPQDINFSCSIRGISLWTPQFPNIKSWKTPTSPLENRLDALPAALLLPPRARGRSSTLTRLFAELFLQLRGNEGSEQFDSTKIPTIYASAYGEMSTTLRLLDQLADDPTLSPLRFQGSVHNTASGKISIATNNRSFSTAVAAGQETFAMALLEAQAWLQCHGGEILLLVADEELPPRLTGKQSYSPLGVGLHLSAENTPSHSWGSVQAVANATYQSTPHLAQGECPSKIASALIENPAAWGLPLLNSMLGQEAGRIQLGPRSQISFTPPLKS